MLSEVYSVAVAAVTVAAAEVADKTMFATAIAAAATREPVKVAAVSTLAFAAANVLAVAAAVVIGSLISGATLSIVAGAAFIALGVAYLVGKGGVEEHGVKGGTVTALFTSIFAAELGDKTQLATMAVALETGAPICTLLGASLGYFAVNAVMATAAAKLSKHVEVSRVRKVSAVAFIAIGMVIIVTALLGY